jgi:hypothetical protein
MALNRHHEDGSKASLTAVVRRRLLLLATLAPLVAAGPALTSFLAATLLLAREPATARI